jgi:hypothetical protein
MTNTIEEQAKMALPVDAVLMQMLSGLWVSKAVGVFAELGLADVMAAGATTAAEVASATGLHEDSVFRLLRMLAGVGVVAEVDAQSFALTPLSHLLRSGVPGSKRAMATLLTSAEHFDGWGKLAHSVRSGQMGVEAALGMDIWQHYRQDAERNAIFNAAMTDFSTMSDASIAASFDFSPYKQICDIGGGLGSQLLAILERNPQALGVIYDQPHVAEAAKRRFTELGVSSKATAIGGDFFQSMPQGPEVFLAKNIIHDWDDERSITILKRVREVIPVHGRMLLLELTIQPADVPHVGRLVDVHMQVMTGGRERTEAEFAALFAASGFRLGRVIPTHSPVFIVEGIPA